MHHAAAQNLQPPGLLADRAAASAAEHTADEHLDARLCVGKEARTEQYLRAVLEELLQKRRQRAFQVGQRDALADDEPLDLLEHRRMREVKIVAAIHFAWYDDANGRLVALHVANLHRRRVRAQQGGRPLGSRRAAAIARGMAGNRAVEIEGV